MMEVETTLAIFWLHPAIQKDSCGQKLQISIENFGFFGFQVFKIFPEEETLTN